jgi:hypothetical protein
VKQFTGQVWSASQAFCSSGSTIGVKGAMRDELVEATLGTALGDAEPAIGGRERDRLGAAPLVGRARGVVSGQRHPRLVRGGETVRRRNAGGPQRQQLDGPVFGSDVTKGATVDHPCRPHMPAARPDPALQRWTDPRRQIPPAALAGRAVARRAARSPLLRPPAAGNQAPPDLPSLPPIVKAIIITS